MRRLQFGFLLLSVALYHGEFCGSLAFASVPAAGAASGAVACTPDAPVVNEFYPYVPDHPVKLGQGYDPVNPLAVFADCFEEVGSRSTGDASDVEIELKRVEDREELYRTVGHEVSLVASGVNWEVAFSNEKLKSHAVTKDSFAFAITASVKFDERTACRPGACASEYPRIRPQYQHLLDRGDTDLFYKKCGKFWVHKVVPEARITLVYSWDNVTAEDRYNLSFGLQAWRNAGSDTLKADAAWQEATKSLTSASTARFSVHILGGSQLNAEASRCFLRDNTINSLAKIQECIADYLGSLIDSEQAGNGRFQPIAFENTHDVDGCYQAGVTKRDDALRLIVYDLEDVEQMFKRLSVLEYERQFGYRDPKADKTVIDSTKNELTLYKEKLENLAKACLDSKESGYSACVGPREANLELPTYPQRLVETLADTKGWSFFRWCLTLKRGAGAPSSDWVTKEILRNIGDAGSSAFSCYAAQLRLETEGSAISVIARRRETAPGSGKFVIDDVDLAPLASLPGLDNLEVIGRQQRSDPYPNTLSGLQRLWQLQQQMVEIELSGFDLENRLESFLVPKKCVGGDLAGLPCSTDANCFPEQGDGSSGGTCVEEQGAWPALETLECSDCRLADFLYSWPTGLRNLVLSRNRFHEIPVATMANQVQAFAPLTKLTFLGVEEWTPMPIDPKPLNFNVAGGRKYSSDYLAEESGKVLEGLILATPYYARYTGSTVNTTIWYYCGAFPVDDAPLKPWTDSWLQTSNRSVRFFEELRELILSQAEVVGGRSAADLENFAVSYTWAGSQARPTWDRRSFSSNNANTAPRGYVCQEAIDFASCNPAAYDVRVDQNDPRYPLPSENSDCQAADGLIPKAACACLLGLQN